MAERTAKPALVSDPALADARWFTDVLQNAGALGDAVVTAVQQRRIGTGQTGHSVAFSLTYDKRAPDAPPTVVGKFPSQEPQSRAAAKTFGLYEREVRFYQDIAETVDIRVPSCYFADIDLEPVTSCYCWRTFAPPFRVTRSPGAPSMMRCSR